jgi:hypothetical protein
MATTTPNYGWPVPTSTDLVKNGATAIEGLGDAIDASLLDLKGGTTGQVLAKATNTDMDFSWTTPTDQTPLTTKGDLFTFSTVDARLGVGTNGQTLVADSTASTGLKWATPATAASGLTLINRTSFSNVATTTTSFDGVFTSTYTQYIIRIESMAAATNTDDLQIQLRYAGPTTQAADYYGAANATGYNSSTITYLGTNNGAALGIASNTGGTGDSGGAGFINITRVGNATEEAHMNGQYTAPAANSASFFGGTAYTARLYTGFLLKSSSSNITGTVSVYGMAKS